MLVPLAPPVGAGTRATPAVRRVSADAARYGAVVRAVLRRRLRVQWLADPGQAHRGQGAEQLTA